jgi:MFS family permease
MNAPKSSILSGTLIAALATVGVCDVAFGLSLQVQPLIMEARGIPAWIIGLNGAAGALGVLIAGPLLPRIIAKFGGRRVTSAAIVVIAFCLAAMALLPPPWWWLPLRLVFGAAVGTLFTVSETWVLTVATNENRGRIMGIYTAMLSVTFAVGPIIVPFTGIHGFLPWGIGIAFVLMGLIPLLFVRIRDVSEDGGHGNVLAVLGRAPVLFACVGAATVFDSVIISFFTIFATRNGVPLAAASSMLAAGIVAGVVFFYPLGLWADRWSKSGVVVICAIGTVISCLLLAPLIATPLIWPLVVLIFTAAFGVYVVALAIIGDVFKGRDMVAASAAVAAMWGVGGVVGPPIAGWMIDNFGINSFPVTLSGVYTMLLVGLLLQRGRVVKHV